MFASPTALFVLVLFVAPLALVLRMSVTHWPLLTGGQGLNFPDNFSKAWHNRFFADSVWFTVKYTVLATVLLIGLGLGLALLVQESSRWQGFLRTAFLVPGALGLASASLLFYVLYSPFAGPFTSEMNALGLSFLGSATSALYSTLFLIVWRFAGFYMLLLLVGLQSIPAELYEAARTDGASARQTFRRITLPLLRPTLALCTVLCVTGSLLAFDQFWILTRGGPDNSTTSLVMVIYREAFVRLDLGSAAGISVVLLVLLAVVSSLQFAVLRRRSA